MTPRGREWPAEKGAGQNRGAPWDDEPRGIPATGWKSWLEETSGIAPPGPAHFVSAVDTSSTPSFLRSYFSTIPPLVYTSRVCLVTLFLYQKRG